MVGPGIVVPQGFWGIVPQKHRARVVQPAQVLKGVLAADLQVLGGQLIGKVHGLVHGIADNHRTKGVQGLLDDLPAGEPLDLPVKGVHRLLGQALVRGNQPR